MPALGVGGVPSLAQVSRPHEHLRLAPARRIHFSYSEVDPPHLGLSPVRKLSSRNKGRPQVLTVTRSNDVSTSLTPGGEAEGAASTE